MLKNVVLNLLTFVVAGAALASFWLALPWLADPLLLLAVVGVVVLAVGFVAVNVFGPKRGARVGQAGIRHFDFWRDD